MYIYVCVFHHYIIYSRIQYVTMTYAKSCINAVENHNLIVQVFHEKWFLDIQPMTLASPQM